MKKLILLIMAMFILAITGVVKAQDDAVMKAWESYMTPGEIHKMIAKK
jgi:hypothetical protein